MPDATADYINSLLGAKPPVPLAPQANPMAAVPPAPAVPSPIPTDTSGMSVTPAQPVNPLAAQAPVAPKPLTTKQRVLGALFTGMGAFKSPQLGQSIEHEIFEQPEENYEKQRAQYENEEERQQEDIERQKGEESEAALRTAQGNEANARAKALENPPPKPTKLQRAVIDDPKNPGSPMAVDFNPQTGQYVEPNTENVIAGAKPFEKPAAAKSPQSVMVNGQPAYAEFQPGKGWTDMQGNPIQGTVQPPPSFAETGLFEQSTAFDPKTGQMVPARFDRRSGKIIGYNGETNLMPISAEAGKEIGTNLEAAREADTRLETMQQNYQDGLKGDQQAMLSLLANHIGMTLGLQKGARITQSIYDEAMQSAPWMARVKSKFDKDGYLTGVTLAPEQMKQMMDLAEQKRGYLWEQAQQTGSNYGVPINVAPMQRSAFKVGDSITQNGHTFRVTKVDKDGKVLAAQ